MTQEEINEGNYLGFTMLQFAEDVEYEQMLRCGGCVQLPRCWVV